MKRSELPREPVTTASPGSTPRDSRESYPVRLRGGAGFFQRLTSHRARQATELRRQVLRLINEQRDLLTPVAIDAVAAADERLAERLASGADSAAIAAGMDELETAANQRLLPYAHGSIRENTKEILVAVTVIFAFTTFFFQLTKIPTNSLLPTLYGITSEDLRNEPNVTVPNRLARFVEYWVHGVSYYEIKARADGTVDRIDPPQTVFPFIKNQKFSVGSETYTVWFPTDRFDDRAGLHLGQSVRAGQDIIKLRVQAGDHLLVDRISYNFRRPRRGEIFVFKTTGIPELPEGQLYIKRLVALGGERVQIGNDQHLIIDGKRLDASTPHFASVYHFGPEPKEGSYFGHVNEFVANRFGHFHLAPLFHDQNSVHVVAPHHYLAMGDNTMNSYDSRAWGDVPDQNVIGKCFFVYWPFSTRWGWKANR